MAVASISALKALRFTAMIMLIVAFAAWRSPFARHSSEQENSAARRRPSQKVRVAAARLRVHSDRQVGRTTPRWIVDLAGEDV